MVKWAIPIRSDRFGYPPCKDTDGREQDKVTSALHTWKHKILQRLTASRIGANQEDARGLEGSLAGRSPQPIRQSIGQAVQRQPPAYLSCLSYRLVLASGRYLGVSLHFTRHGGGR